MAVLTREQVILKKEVLDVMRQDGRDTDIVLQQIEDNLNTLNNIQLASDLVREAGRTPNTPEEKFCWRSSPVPGSSPAM